MGEKQREPEYPASFFVDPYKFLRIGFYTVGIKKNREV